MDRVPVLISLRRYAKSTISSARRAEYQGRGAAPWWRQTMLVMCRECGRSARVKIKSMRSVTPTARRSVLPNLSRLNTPTGVPKKRAGRDRLADIHQGDAAERIELDHDRNQDEPAVRAGRRDHRRIPGVLAWARIPAQRLFHVLQYGRRAFDDHHHDDPDDGADGRRRSDRSQNHAVAPGPQSWAHCAAVIRPLG